MEKKLTGFTPKKIFQPLDIVLKAILLMLIIFCFTVSVQAQLYVDFTPRPDDFITVGGTTSYNQNQYSL